MKTPATGPTSNFPSRLSANKQRVEARLAARGSQYISRQHSEAIYLGIDPHESYSIFQVLSEYMGDRLAGVRRVAEIGSGLSINSFVLSQLLPQVTEVTGLEIDPVLLNNAKAIKRELEIKFGFALSAVKFKRQDVLTADLSDYDALVGWFPLASHISDKQLLQVFRQLRPGALLIQLSNLHPLDAAEDNDRKGFRAIMPDYPGYLPAAVFERI